MLSSSKKIPVHFYYSLFDLILSDFPDRIIVTSSILSPAVNCSTQNRINRVRQDSSSVCDGTGEPDVVGVGVPTFIIEIALRYLATLNGKLKNGCVTIFAAV